jgi:hypothetical protein
MIYNWTQIGIKEITSLYLYKQMATPSDLTNETIIRPKDVSETMRYGADIEVDMFTYMTTGPGRFALGSESAMVQAFFSTVSDLSWMEPGKAYKKADLISHLQLDPKSDRITIRQVELADAASDYWQRSYIWNSGLFKLSDDVTFTIMPKASAASIIILYDHLMKTLISRVAELLPQLPTRCWRLALIPGR